MIPAVRRVSVVIPHQNGKTLLTRILADLAAQSLPPSEIIVVDDGSRDGSLEVARAAGATVLESRGHGFSAAVNTGVAAASGELIAILNNDVELSPGWLAALVNAIGGEQYAFATGKLMQADQPDRIDGAWDAICRGGASWRCGHGRPDAPVWNERREIALASLTATVFRRELFSRVGLLDEHFESYLEDIDLGIRCALAGERGLYIPDAVGRHKGSATLGRWNPDTVRRIARNQLFLVARYYSGKLLLRYGWPILVSQLLWGVIAVRHGAGWAWLSGKLAGLQRFRSMRGKDRTRDAALRRLLVGSEREIAELQRRTGFDWYWKLYFALT